MISDSFVSNYIYIHICFDHFCLGLLARIPSVIATDRSRLSTAEDELEDFLKSRKDWERELAAEQLASKKKPSTSITEKSNKKRISAFGGLSMFSVSAKRGSGLNPPADQLMGDNDDEEVFTTFFTK